MTLSTEGTPPIPRDSHVSVVHGQSMYVFGGSTGSAMNDFHELRLDKCAWRNVSGEVDWSVFFFHRFLFRVFLGVLFSVKVGKC